MVSQKFEKYVGDNLGNFAKEVVRLASQKSVSARNAGVDECSTLVEKKLK